MNDFKSALIDAIAMEEKGYDFYKTASQKTSNLITKKTFDFLAKFELDHIENIKKFITALESNLSLDDSQILEIKIKHQNDSKIFSQEITELKQKIFSADDDKKACEFAMDFEKKGYHYYQELLKSADNEKISSLLKFLLEEEGSHYEYIQNLHTYLSDSSNWNMYEEGIFPQGG